VLFVENFPGVLAHQGFFRKSYQFFNNNPLVPTNLIYLWCRWFIITFNFFYL